MYPLSDFGLYCTETFVEFYPIMQTATTAFSSGQYVHLILTRDSLTDLVKIYIDGALGFSFIDSTDLALLDSNNLLTFFIDDGLEESSGNISLLRLYKNVLDASDVRTNYNQLHSDLSPITIYFSRPG